MKQDTKQLVVVGGGGHAKVIIGILKKLKKYQLVGYTDLKDNKAILGASYLGSDQALTALIEDNPELQIVLGVGQVGLGGSRHEIWTRLQSFSLPFPPIISPDAVVNENVQSGEGVVVMNGAVVNCGASLGRGAIVNTNSTVEHDAVVGEWSHVAPGATICGDVRVGDFSMIGAGATVIEGIKIAPCCIVGAGTTVIQDLTEPGVYVGNPARRVR
jgi:sugar O-acyltransferase (sialic acid O-acetyltransferase NeuD family)